MDKMNDLCALLDMDDIEEKSAKTKRGLLPSIIAVIVCIAMLAGTTLAWFTDTTSSGRNQIRSGNLDVEVEYIAVKDADWKSLDGATDLFEGALFEPGYTRVVAFKIVNNGGVALKYKVGMNVLSETKGVNKAGDEFLLSDYLKVNTYSTTEASAVDTAFKSREDAKTIAWTEHTFNDLATHLAADEKNIIKTGGAQYFIMQVYMPETVNNIANAESTSKTAAIDFGVDVVATQYTHEKDSYDDQYDKDATYSAAEPLVYSGEDAVATIDYNIKADGDYGVIRAKNGAKLTLKGDAVAIESQDRYAMAVWADGADTTVTIEDGYYTQEITGPDDQYDLIYASGGAEIVITGGVFKIGGGDPKWTLNCRDNSGSVITVKGGTFWKFDPSAARTGQATEVVVPDGYKVVQDGDWYTVVAE